MECMLSLIMLSIGCFAWTFIIALSRNTKRASLIQKIETQSKLLKSLIETSFLVRPCPSCYEYSMEVVNLSPNARSLQYRCLHCDKKIRSAAGSKNSSKAIPVWNKIVSLTEECNNIPKTSPIKISLSFSVSPDPLPYEQTLREPISDAIKGVIWRRDDGRCVKCNSKENLQFDHIIPVAKGGATSVENLQLLCRQCNLAKGAKI